MDDLEVKRTREEEEYFADRVKNKIDAYSKRGDRNKHGYWCLAVVAAIGAALVPALINIGDIPDGATTIASLVVAVALALEGIFRPRELWRSYDMIAAGLRAQEMLFSTRAEPYDGPDAFRTFVERIEGMIAEERAETMRVRTTPSRVSGEPQT